MFIRSIKTIRPRPGQRIMGTTYGNELLEGLRGLQTIPDNGTVLDAARARPQMVQILQNGNDPDGNPKYDVYSLNDTGHLHKLNVDPVVPENDRNPLFVYAAGETGLLQLNDNNDFFLLVFNERASCP